MSANVKTNKQRVLKRRPGAFARRLDDGSFSVYAGVGLSTELLGHGKSASAAWHDAARKLRV